MKFRSIQYMRGIAAMSVVIFHILINTFGSAAGEAEPHIFFFSGGVDLFFVISGFVMFASTGERQVGAWDFMKARIIRLVPLYWVSLLVMLAFLAVSQNYTPPLREIFFSFGFMPYKNEFGVKGPLFNPGWTLNYEMFFYAIFAMTLCMRNYVWRFIGVAAVFFGLISMKRFLAPLGMAGEEFASGLSTEFLMGMLVWVAYRRGWIRSPLLLVCAGIALAVYLMETSGFRGPRMLYAGVPAALILAGLVQMEPSVWNLPLLGLIGDASYSLYLSHAFVIDLVEELAPFDRVPALTAVAFAASVAVGILVYVFLEKPLLNMARSAFMKKRHAVNLEPSASAAS